MAVSRRRSADMPPVIDGRALVALHTGLALFIGLMAWWTWSLPA
ncbi:hypothetical protein [Gluconacetobacter azotocaptans]|nr:hypothetical protein [Gluconacetobacter azotocaptans]